MMRNAILLSLLAIPAIAVPSPTWTVTSLFQNPPALRFTDTSGQCQGIDITIPSGQNPPDFASAEITTLTNQCSAISVEPPIGSIVIPTPKPVPVIDPNAAIEAQFQADYLLLRQMESLINHKIMPSTDSAYIAQLATVTSELSANRTILQPLVNATP